MSEDKRHELLKELALSVVVDLFSRRIVGWTTSGRMNKNLALTLALRPLLICDEKTGEGQSVIAHEIRKFSHQLPRS